jgi:hypothetical protein
MKIYSYIVKSDTGLAPNPFWGRLTLNVCKPDIRRTASKNNWVIGTGSKSVKTKIGDITDYSGKLVYAMKVTDVMTMKEYDNYCTQELKKKIPFPDKKEWKRIVGDSIYDFSIGGVPRLRKVLHDEDDKETDLSGKNTLISNHFYYFGNKAETIPKQFSKLVKKEQGHLIVDDIILIEEFEKWLSHFELNKLYGDPQLLWKIEEGEYENCKVKCDN